MSRPNIIRSLGSLGWKYASARQSPLCCLNVVTEPVCSPNSGSSHAATAIRSPEIATLQPKDAPAVGTRGSRVPVRTHSPWSFS